MNASENLERAAVETVEEYRSEHGEIPVERQDVKELLEDGEDASREEVERFLDEQVDFYDELLEVDSSGLREKFQEDLRYDPSRREVAGGMLQPVNLAFTATGFPVGAALTTAVGPPEMAIPVSAVGTLIASYKLSEESSEGFYMPFNDTIGAGKEERPAPAAYKTLASELFHAYQIEHGSGTWSHPYLREGLERAASLKALQETEHERAADALEAHVLVNGWGQLADLLDEEHGLELEPGEQEALDENIGDDGNMEYNVAASLVHAQEPDVYSRLFHGDYTPLEEELEFLDGKENTLQDIKYRAWDFLEQFHR